MTEKDYKDTLTHTDLFGSQRSPDNRRVPWEELLDEPEDLFLEGSGLTSKDIINSPNHYTVGGYEAIDVMQAKLTPDEFIGYLKGNALKYLMRANYKGDHDNDIAKSRWYLEELEDAVEIRTKNSG